MLQLIAFLTFEFLIVLLLVYWNRTYWNYRVSNVKIALIASLFFYVSLLIMVYIINYTLKNELHSFDLNKDSNFSAEERTPEQAKAMKAVVSDTGRNLAPSIGILYSLIYFIIIRIPLSLFNRSKITNNSLNINPIQ